MTIDLKTLITMASKKHSVPMLRSIIFDGKSAMCVSEMSWVAGVPCLQENITEPVVVPVDALKIHLLKSRHLIVMPDHLTNGQGLVTPFGIKPNDFDGVLDLLPAAQPVRKPVIFDLDLNVLDRVAIVAGQADIRYYLNGVLFDLTHCVIVGTDGHRLNLYKNRIPKAFKRKIVDGVPTTPVVEVIMPREPLDWMLRSASHDVTVTIWNADKPAINNHVQTPGVLLKTADAFVWIKKPIDGKYPDWQRVVPKIENRPIVMEVNPVELANHAESLAKIIKVEGSQFFGIYIDFGAGTISTGNKKVVLPLTTGVASTKDTVNHEAYMDSLWMGVHAGYLQDLADCVTGAARWYCDHENASNRSLLAVDGDFMGVVMPMQLSDKAHDGTRVFLEAQAAQEAAKLAASHYATEEAAKQPEIVAAAEPEPVAAVVVPEAAQEAQEEPVAA